MKKTIIILIILILGTLGVATAKTPTELQTGLIPRILQFIPMNGTATDFSGNNKDFTVLDAVQFSSDFAYLDGTSCFYRPHDPELSTANFTMIVFLNTTQFSFPQIILENGQTSGVEDRFQLQSFSFNGSTLQVVAKDSATAQFDTTLTLQNDAILNHGKIVMIEFTVMPNNTIIFSYNGTQDRQSFTTAGLPNVTAVVPLGDHNLGCSTDNFGTGEINNLIGTVRDYYFINGSITGEEADFIRDAHLLFDQDVYSFSVGGVDWDANDPATNSNFNTNFSMNFTLTNVDTLATCDLNRGGLFHQQLTTLSSGINTFNYDSTGNSATHQFQINCTDNSATYTTSIKTIRVDTLNPTITIINPTIDNQTKADQSIALNITVNNDFLNNSYVNISGGGDQFFTQNLTGTPIHKYNNIVNTSTWTEGIKIITVFADDQLNTNLATLQFTICNAVWVCNGYNACGINDNATCNSVMDTACGFNESQFTGNVTSLPPLTCNFCTSTFGSVNSSCLANLKDVGYQYTNTCCSDTNLTSDCNLPSNQTGVSCSAFAYTDADITKAATDGIIKFLIFIGSFATLIVIVWFIGKGMGKAR